MSRGEDFIRDARQDAAEELREAEARAALAQDRLSRGVDDCPYCGNEKTIGAESCPTCVSALEPAPFYDTAEEAAMER